MRISRCLPAFAGAALLLSGCSLLGPADAVRDGESGEITEAADADAFSVRVGDCLTLLGSEAEGAAEVDSLPTVPCTEPHDSEVYLAEQITDAEYPGEEAAGVMADELCYGAFEGFVGMAYEESALDFTTLFPTQQSWDDMEDREILCIVVDGEGGVTGSLKGVAR
ncbi:septum formation family protein [Actinotalea sp. Marseille-Q4924]|uniref:septum formation family protein n=1 Tax=Actinotalea sp. Marseille-Q4924 TaxID=2866571 RepID=UPI001CE3DD6B|nr:septum formation family protein [Actinotalea sp. Marseille-Q4924]